MAKPYLAQESLTMCTADPISEFLAPTPRQHRNFVNMIQDLLDSTSENILYFLGDKKSPQ